MTHTDLPEWVWDLLDALDKYEEEHPALTAQGPHGPYPAACFGTVAQGIIPSEVIEIAALMRQRSRERDINVKAQAWHEGFDACAHEHMTQRQDPEHPITRDNPYQQVPF